jgi:hypothetical protein
MDENLGTDWPVRSEPPPVLTNHQWFWMSLVGFVLVLMALLQLFSFSSFDGTFQALGINPHRLWAAIVIIAELWGAASLFRVRLSRGFRSISRLFAGGTALFWSAEAIRAWVQIPRSEVLINGSYRLPGTGFFGRFLYQQPGWWAVIEAVVLCYLILYALEISRSPQGVAAKVKVKRRS